MNKINKYISLISILIVIGIGIVSPVLITHFENNWAEESKVTTNQIMLESREVIHQQELSLESALKNIKKYLFSNNSLASPNQNAFLNYIKNEYPTLSVIIYNGDGNPVLWSNYINGYLANSISEVPDKIFFCDLSMKKYLGIKSQIKVLSDNLSINILRCISKDYRLPIGSSNELLEDVLTKKFGVKFIFNSSGNSSISDKSLSVYNILDKDGRKIFDVSFPKPRRVEYIDNIKNTFATAQSVLLIIGILFLLFYSSTKIFKIKSNIYRLLIYVTIAVFFRILIYLLGIPEGIFHTNLANPEYFSSHFAFGIVKSPLEFLITGIFAVLIAIILFRFTAKYFRYSNVLNSNSKYFTAMLSIIILSVLLIRAVGATSKSVIFDSSINYFSDFNLISKPPAVLMQINTLLFGFTIFLIIISTLLLLLTNHRSSKGIKSLFLIFSLTVIFGILFHILQPSPQVSIPIIIMIIVFLFFVAYLIAEKKISIPKTLFYTAFISSFATAILLNYYNTKQEKDALKNIAFELSQSKSNYYEYLITQTLNSKRVRQVAMVGIKSKEINKSDMAAFEIWSNSNLSSESAKMNIEIFDRHSTLIGNFNLGLESKEKNANFGQTNNAINLKIEKKTLKAGNTTLIGGSIPLVDQNNIIGFLSINILDEIGIVHNVLPEFLTSPKPFVNSAINDQQLNIYELYGSKLFKQSSNVNLSSKKIKFILQSHYNKFNEVWINTKLSGKDFTLYAYKSDIGSITKTIVIGIKEKEIAFGLFHFFKVLFIHSALIILLLFLYFVLFEKNRIKILRSFDTKLFTAFLIISIVPLVLMAISIRELTDEKNDSAIYYKLEKRAKSVEQYLIAHSWENNKTSEKYFNKISKNLNIKYSIYDNNKLIYSSYKQYFNIGLFPNIVNSAVYYEQKNMGLKTYVVKEKIGNKSFNAFYLATTIKGENIVIEISDAFNPILLPMSGTELDIFLFGSYSLAIILIIVFSTILAKQISSPIRQLTVAAKSVASGDLNLEVVRKEEGEVKDLVNEFNYMVKELKKSQKALAEIERETAWKEMAKQVAHEVKNPLTPMKLSVQQLVIAYKEKSPKFEKIFYSVTGTVIKQIEILKNIASEFSSFAKMPKIKLEKIELLSSLNDVKNLFENEKAKINISANTDEVFVNADANQLKRTLVNLVRNSIQANAEFIEIKIDAIKSVVEIRVIDDGDGIPLNKLSKVFEVDFTTKEKGMGLGLSIAKKSIENIGGEINVESTSPQGTVVIIKLSKV